MSVTASAETHYDSILCITERSVAKKSRRMFFSTMTGYAQARSEQNGWAVRVSVRKSVNHRFLDLKLRLPEGFDLYELRLRQALRERIHRGHIEVHVNVDPAAGALQYKVNREILAQTYTCAWPRKFPPAVSRAAADVDVVAILRLPGVIAGLFRRRCRKPRTTKNASTPSVYRTSALLRKRSTSWMICVVPKAAI